MTPLATFLADVRATKATGAHTAETSFYPALKMLFDAAGANLKPRVHCVMNLRNQGAGLPDGGFFTADQVETRGAPPADNESAPLQVIPARGVVEVKPPSWSMKALAGSSQVTRYGRRYRHTLITNIREFWLIEHDASGNWRTLEQLQLASSEEEFWRLVSRPEAAAKKEERRVMDFLARVLKTPAPLTAPEDLAWFLASYARQALDEVENAPVAGFTDIAAALEQALGVGFGSTRGRHFFNSTLVQTLFYGVFSAWVLWSRRSDTPGERFSWRDTSDLLHLPMLRVLFHEMTRPTTLFTKFLREGLDHAERTLNRVDRSTFFDRFAEHHAVQYFYEPFLEAFDPELRKELGVWYTPDEVVHYMVERVDRALRTELGITSGLADPAVQVLDPCCGTGAFLVAVLERIARTLREQGEDATVAAQVAQAATERIIGFEILPAPFVVAHLQVGLCLQELGAPLAKDNRASIYLTNSLIGWEKGAGKQLKLLPELAEERDAADRVKQKTRILVVIGNPPYNAFAGIQPVEEQESVQPYKEGLGTKWGIRKYNLDDLYVRFFRVAERKIAEQTKRGIVCFISNSSYATDASFAVFRERFLGRFDSITIDNLNGDSRETGKLTPDGKSDPSIFSTERNREGIRVGTAVGLFVLTGKKRSTEGCRVLWRDFWGTEKRQQLLACAESSGGYIEVKPKLEVRWSFKPLSGNAAYLEWPRVTELCEFEPVSGLAEKRSGGLLAMERQRLVARMQAYFDAERSWEDVRTEIVGLAEDAGRYPAKATRTRLLKAGEQFEEKQLLRYALLPFDNRWCYHSTARPLWNEPRPSLAAQEWEGNRFFITRMNAERPTEQHFTTITTALPDHHLLRPNIVAIPLRWRSEVMGRERVSANLSKKAREYLAGLELTTPDDNEEHAALLWWHALAITYSPAYQRANADAIRSDFPRVPLPQKRATLEKSAALGRQLADLLDPEIDVPGVTSGTIRPGLRPLGVLHRVGGKQIDPAAGHLAVAARWGILQRESVVMPGPGRLTNTIETKELADHPLVNGAQDVWMNSEVCWGAVPQAVWDFTIGGHQVIKKWLSYREKAVLGRDLTLAEAQYVTAVVRRLAAVVLMEAELDNIYAASNQNRRVARST
jgi:hypothetical protein